MGGHHRAIDTVYEHKAAVFGRRLVGVHQDPPCGTAAEAARAHGVTNAATMLVIKERITGAVRARILGK